MGWLRSSLPRFQAIYPVRGWILDRAGELAARSALVEF
jgi:hypothetical protein